MKQRLAILGSTGSIGRQTLDIVRAHPDRFEAAVLTANRNWERLATQAREFRPDSVVIACKEHYKELSDALAGEDIKVYAGDEAVEQIVRSGEIDTVVNALVGYAGLAPTLAAIEAGKKLALANKESLVAAGEIVMRRALELRVPIVPIDSEHSAIFQCLAGEVSPIERLILTASGGPFLGREPDSLHNVTVEEALRHPQWTMGAKITIDSATMLNKGFEVIEAHWLFGTPAERIEVVIHPQSIIHSMVEFADGAVKAQLGTPDMRVPIQYALTFPERAAIDAEKINFAACANLTFSKPDTRLFPLLEVAYEALRRGGNIACALNAANEVAVEAFLAGKIAFTAIEKTITSTLEKITFIDKPTIEDLRATNAEAREISSALSKQYRK